MSTGLPPFRRAAHGSGLCRPGRQLRSGWGLAEPWSSLTMADVHGVAALPGPGRALRLGTRTLEVVVQNYFADYEARYAVRSSARSRPQRDRHRWLMRWRAATELVRRDPGQRDRHLGRPFIPYYFGAESSPGAAAHPRIRRPGSVRWPARDRGSAVGRRRSSSCRAQRVGDHDWVTRRVPRWRTTPFTESAGRGRRRAGRGTGAARAAAAERGQCHRSCSALQEQEEATGAGSTGANRCSSATPTAWSGLTGGGRRPTRSCGPPDSAGLWPIWPGSGSVRAAGGIQLDGTPPYAIRGSVVGSDPRPGRSREPGGRGGALRITEHLPRAAAPPAQPQPLRATPDALIGPAARDGPRGRDSTRHPTSRRSRGGSARWW